MGVFCFFRRKYLEILFEIFFEKLTILCKDILKIMEKGKWVSQVQELFELLNSLSVRDKDGKELEPEKGFQEWLVKTFEVRNSQKVVYLIGNGASASMASHFSADLAKNAHIHTQVFSDLSLITAISNDLGYEHVFEEPLRRRGMAGDMLVAISSSGNSKNILGAVKLADSLGMESVTLSGMSFDNPLRKLGKLNFHVSGKTYGAVETCHSAILHHWMDLVAESSGGK